MDFSYSEEQTMLADSLRKLLDGSYDQAARAGFLESDLGHSETHWAQFAEQGLLALPIEEAYGGFGGSETDVMVTCIELGRRLCLEPFVETVVLGAGLIGELGTEAQKDRLLPEIAAGSLKLAGAFLEPQSRYDLEDISTSATRDGDGYCLNGHKAVALGGDWWAEQDAKRGSG